MSASPVRLTDAPPAILASTFFSIQFRDKEPAPASVPEPANAKATELILESEVALTVRLDASTSALVEI